MNGFVGPFAATLTSTPKQKPTWSELKFGTIFSDHMLVMEFDEGRWKDPRIIPYGELPLNPAAAVLHYGQAVFEGLKAFRGDDDRIRLFRPQPHADRLKQSCELMCIPSIAPQLVVETFRQLVALEHEWVPPGQGNALYLRPTILATEPFISVRVARQYLYYLILSPVGPYYPGMVRLLANDKRVRAAGGGIGNAKAAANYAASIPPGDEAIRQGYSQVLWLDARYHEYLEEAGNMNVMAKIGDTIVTPPLAGTILPGITRDTTLRLLQEWGERVEERPISIKEVIENARSGDLTEMWGTGTAAVISGIGEIHYKGEDIQINQGKRGSTTTRLFEEIVGIQYGKTNDARGWTEIVR